MESCYSAKWFELFLRTIPSSQTDREIEFLRRQLPNPPFRSVLDLCCGEGRHAIALARIGYEVIGIDANDSALAIARENAPAGAVFIQGDMRRLEKPQRPFDAAICLWQSFGYFDEATNKSVLRQIAGLLRPAGRLILDVYHRQFIEHHQGRHTFQKNGLTITEEKHVAANRLTVQLSDASGALNDCFQWQIFTPDELRDAGNSCGLKTMLVCTDFHAWASASPDKPRMQIVFERT